MSRCSSRSSEIFPVDVRTTGNGIASGIAKIGAFAGAALLPALLTSWGLTDMILIPAAVSLAGALFNLLLPEPSGTALEDISDAPPRQQQHSPTPRRHTTVPHRS